MNDIVLYACVDTHKHTHTHKNGERIHVFFFLKQTKRGCDEKEAACALPPI